MANNIYFVGAHTDEDVKKAQNILKESECPYESLQNTFKDKKVTVLFPCGGGVYILEPGE